MNTRAPRRAPKAKPEPPAATAATPLPRRIEYVRLFEIEFAKRNPKNHADAQIAASIARFGLAEVPLRDDRTGRLVAGHGRILDLRRKRANGDSPPDGVVLDSDGEWLVPVIAGWRSPSDDGAQTYVIGSNRIGEVGGWDKPSLGEDLQALADADTELVELAGFDAAQLTRLLAELAAAGQPPAQPETVHVEFNAAAPAETQCPACGHRW